MKVQKVERKADQTGAYLPLVTVTVEIGGKVRELDGYEMGEGDYRHVCFSGLAVRYRTGEKIWPGRAIYWFKSGNVNNVRGPQDHRQRFHNLFIVGFWDDVEDRNRSEHSSVSGRAK